MMRRFCVLTLLGFLVTATASAGSFDSAVVPFAKNDSATRSALERYAKAESSKALAISRETGSLASFVKQASQAEAARRALQSCEFKSEAPCVLYAVDDEVQAPALQAGGNGAQGLIGTWKGELSGYGGADGKVRTLNILRIAPDGAAEGAWTTTRAGTDVSRTKLNIQGETVTVQTRGNSTVVLQKKGAGLQGTLTSKDGKSYPIAMERLLAPDPGQFQPKASIQWEGGSLEPDLVPFVSDSIQKRLAGDLRAGGAARSRFKALAVHPSGSFGWAYGSTPLSTKESALEKCRTTAKADCYVYWDGVRIVLKDRLTK